MKKAIFRTSLGVAAIATAMFLIAGFWRPGIFRGQPNDGHQLGGDLFENFDGNTIECFTRAVELFEQNDSWRYAECDVRETRDHHLILFHDWDISSLKSSEENKAALGEPVNKQAIRDLTLRQLQSLRLNCGAKIPTLEQALVAASELNLQKPMLLELKHLHSDQARDELLKLAIHYRDNHGIKIHFLSFIRNIEICFPNARTWMKRFSDNDFRVYQVYRPKTDKYDLCNSW